MKKRIAQVITLLTIGFFVIAFLIMVIGTIAIKQNEPLFIFNRAITAIPSGSMQGNLEDSLEIGDLAIIKKGSYEEVEIGDIIVFQQTITDQYEFLIIHRVVDKTQEGYVTKGDANNAIDKGYVTEDNYQGIYISKITWLRPIVRNITSNLGRSIIFASIILCLLIFLIFELTHLVKMISDKQKEDIKRKSHGEIERLKQQEVEKIIKEELSKQKKE